MIGFVDNDGGRWEAGFVGVTSDCVVRAVAIATERPYADVYAELRAMCKQAGEKSPRLGVSTKMMRAYLAHLGWEWTPTMRIGSGTTVHLRAAELPDGRIICRLSGHVCAVIDGVVHDTFDPTRDGTRCVYGYWRPS